jgi:glycosyltransferase involved in cell wall biosynthesis
MKDILIIRTANLTTLDILINYIKKRYAHEEIKVSFLVQKNALTAIKGKYPDSNFFIVDEVIFNYNSFKQSCDLKNEFRKINFDEIYIPSSSGAFDDFMEVMLIAAKIGARKYVFYSYTGESYEKRLNFICLMVEKNFGEVIYLVRLVWKLLCISLRYVVLLPLHWATKIVHRFTKKPKLTDGPLEKKVCILSTCHDLYDRRIYEREALTLKEHGYEPTCIVISDHDETGVTKEGIRYIKVKPVMKKVRNIYRDKILVLDCYTSGHRFGAETYAKLFNIATVEKYDIYHFHDLYINLIGPRLKRLPHRPKVIYDVHESYPAVIRDYLNQRGLRRWNQYLFSLYIDFWEKLISRQYDFVITVEDTINERFQRSLGHEKVDIIYNYPKIDPDVLQQRYVAKEYDLIYCGGITDSRGAMDLLHVANFGKKYLPDLKMVLIGPIFGAELEANMRKYLIENQLEQNVIIQGKIPFAEVYGYHQKSKVGLILLHPANNHQFCIPSKLFEYMMNGVPVVGTAMYHVQRIINQAGCGKVVQSADDIQAVWEAVFKLLNDQELYYTCSNNAKEAVKNIYNWDVMGRKLLQIYQNLD